MPITLTNSTVTVTTAGTRTQVTSSTSIYVESIYIEALGTNTGYMYIGNSDVSSTKYVARLGAGQGWWWTAPSSGGSGYKAVGQGLQISSLYIDSSVSGEKVQVTYNYHIGTQL